jgi:uncharacterized protein YkwD
MRIPVALALALILVTVAPAASATRVELERAVLTAVNAVRQQHGVAPLTEDPVLSDIARRHSCAMAEQGFFEHADPGGISMAQRLGEARKPYLAAGENLARIDTSGDPVAPAVDGWMKSPGHRENILSPRFTATGVGVCKSGRVVYVTQMFLRPR